MTADELKRSIILFAASGKLVPQVSEEGDSKVLIDEMTKTREKLIESGNIKDSKKKEPMPISLEDILFEIPDTWSWQRLSSVCNFQAGKTPERHNESYWKSGTVPWISISDMIDGGVVNSTKECITKKAISDVFSEGIVEPGTLLMSFKLTIGKTCFVDMPCTHNEAIVSIYPYLNGEKCSIFKQYLCFVLPLLAQYGDFNNAVKGKTLNATSISQIMLPIPPIEEQRRIVQTIKDIIPFIDKYKKSWIELGSLNKGIAGKVENSILKYAFEGKLVKQNNEEEPVDLSSIKKIETEDLEFDLPSNWQIAHLEAITEGEPSKQYQILESEVKSEGLFPVISQSKEYSIGYCDDSSKVFHHNDPVIIFGDHTAEVKMVDFDFVVGADGVKIFIPNTNVVLCKYLFYTMKYLCIGMSETGGYSRHYKYLKNKAVPIPPMEEQHRIVTKLEELLPLCRKLVK